MRLVIAWSYMVINYNSVNIHNYLCFSTVVWPDESNVSHRCLRVSCALRQGIASTTPLPGVSVARPNLTNVSIAFSTAISTWWYDSLRFLAISIIQTPVIIAFKGLNKPTWNGVIETIFTAKRKGTYFLLEYIVDESLAFISNASAGFYLRLKLVMLLLG